ncbi:MAG: tetratricopeptide repeat-containing protein [Crocinitomicaceae bacterium]|nr:tetratricopeptide repeat-containing protein [Crocinitomicaceae bacterium]
MRLVGTIMLVFIGLTALGQKKKDVKEADKLFKKGLYEEAMPMYRTFINMDANNMDYVYKYGSCLVMVTDKTDEALKYLLKAEEMGKKDEDVAFFIGRAYEKKGEYEKALKYYERFKLATEKEEWKKLKVKKRMKACKKAIRKMN